MFMTKRMLVAFLLVCILAVVTIDLYAEGMFEDSPVGISADIAINSDYIWRGFMLDDNQVMQQGAYVSAYGFTVSIWGSFGIASDNSMDSDEVDYTVDYTYSTDAFSLSMGHTYYDFPSADLSSKEFYAGVGLNVASSPTLTLYRDYGDEDSGGGDGDYTVLELSHNFPLGESPVTFDLSGHVGYNDGLFIEGDGGDAAVGVGLTIPLTDTCSLSASVNYSVPFGDLEDAGGQDDKFYAGVVLAFGI